MYFSVKSACLARDVDVCDEIVYCHCDRVDSLSYSLCTKPGEVECRLKVALREYSLLSSYGHERSQDLTILYSLWYLFKEDRAAFKRCFALARDCGAPRWRYLVKGMLVDCYGKLHMRLHRR